MIWLDLDSLMKLKSAFHTFASINPSSSNLGEFRRPKEYTNYAELIRSFSTSLRMLAANYHAQ
jgi:hypothetical protein